MLTPIAVIGSGLEEGAAGLDLPHPPPAQARGVGTEEPGSTAYRGVAEVAMQQGIHASRTITRRLRGEDSTPFRYRDLGSMATVARFRAVVSFKGIRVAGSLGWVMWLFVHLAFLTGFRNRFATILGWAVTFFGRGRGERTATMQQVVGRVAIEEAGGRPFVIGLTHDASTDAD
jgi:hypothetical protein